MTDNRRFEILGNAGRIINSSLDLDSVIERVIDSIIEATGAERGFVMLAAEGSDDLEMRVGRNVEGNLLESPSFQISRNVVQQVQQSGQAAVINDAMSDPRFESFQSVVELELRSILCAPLIAQDRVIGVVYLDNRIRRGLFDQDDLELATAIADLSAAAIENASLYGSLDGRMREVQELKDYQDSVFRSVSSALISIDRQGRLTSLNAAALELLQLGVGAAEGELYTSVFGDQLSNRLLPLVARATGLRGESQRPREFECELPIRGRVSLRLSVAPLMDKQAAVLGCVVVMDDLTEIKELESARLAEEAEKDRIRAIFGRFVPERVVTQLVSDPGALELGGTLQEITVLFGDIRGYTSISENMEPADIVAALNRYLAISTKSILERNGTLDKYIGDAVMAIFNAPVAVEHHGLAAVLAALDMQIAVNATGGNGFEVRYGVGLNTGMAVVGNIGTEAVMNYTAIGDAVNVAARLQSNAKPGEILMSKSTFDLVEPWIEAVAMEPLHVKGRAEPVAAYRVVGTRTRAEAPPGLDMTRHLPSASSRRPGQ